MPTRSTSHPTPPPVVVGVDGSAAGDAALHWAVDEAARRGSPLRVVHALDRGDSEAFLLANPVFVAAQRAAAEQVLDDAVDRACGRAPGLDVRPVLEVGFPAVVLLEQAGGGDVVVVGSRGRGGFAGLLLGSTSMRVVQHARGTVVVVRCTTGDVAAGPSAGRIVVGADGSPSDEPALRFAFDRARSRGLGVTALRAWPPPAVYLDTPAAHRWELLEKEAEAVLSADVEPWRVRYPQVDVVERVVFGSAGGALVAESAGAELVVVGRRGRGGVAGLLLGSVGQTALHHARCPVAVVPAAPGA
jgi:nucleotide-binding universal stress UspA family protein